LRLLPLPRRLLLLLLLLLLLRLLPRVALPQALPRRGHPRSLSVGTLIQ
jgi:hypothetical protein